MSKEHVQGIIGFFKGEFWNDFVDNHLRHPDEVVYHAHIYADTNVHPDSLFPITYAYWKAKGLPITRTIDPMSPKEYVGALHSVAPMGLPAFDFFYRFNKSTVLGPMPPDIPQAENGKNKLSWGKKFQDQFVKQFDFKVVAEEEDKQIKAYYLTKHWKDTITNVMNPQIMHCHANFEINFDPKIFELYTRQALVEIGWRVEKVVPCVYDVKGTYTGKNVFLVGYPEKVFDTTWRFNPDVVIRSSEESFLYGIDPGFDIWYRPQLDKVLDANNFYKMSNDEISEVIASFNR